MSWLDALLFFVGSLACIVLPPLIIMAMIGEIGRKR